MAIYFKENDNIRKCDPNTLFLLEILFDGITKTTRFKKIFLNQTQIMGIEKVVLSSLKKLPIFTQTVIQMYYGIGDFEKKNLINIADFCKEWPNEYAYFNNVVKEEYEEIGKDSTEIEEYEIAEKIVQSCIRRLWQPSRQVLEHCIKGINYSKNSYFSSFEFWKVIKDEIYNFITTGRNYHYLNAILKKHNIGIESDYIEDIEINIKVEDMGLSSRLLNCLVQKGIDNLCDLKLYSDESLMGIDNLGKGCLEEINEKKKIYGVETRGFSFKVEENGEKIVHKLKGMSEKEIVQYIFDIFFPDERPTIFRDMIISQGLLNLLLLKGFAFIDEVKKDKDAIYKELLQCFPEYSEEFELLFTEKKLYINCSDEVDEWIKNHGIDDIKELEKAVAKLDMKELQQEIINLFLKDEELLSFF